MSYDGRTFISKENSSNGEVDGRTRFHYRQNGSTVWTAASRIVVYQGHRRRIAGTLAR